MSFGILENAAAALQAGQTEKDIARTLVHRYREHGVTTFFHLPVVLFGERTALPGDWPIGKFYPKSKTLQEGDSVILDAAPFFAGHLVDTSYSFCFGENPAHRSMMANLARFRASVCAAVNAGRSFKSIAEDVNAELSSMGYEAVHRKHPGEVLGHRAIKTARLPFTPRYRGFDAVSLGWFLLKEKWAESGLGRRSPLWNDRKSSEHKPHDGLWLIEPHAGADGVGAKWEEILIIENGRARWLDDKPPHVLQWAAIANDHNYAPRAAT